MIAGEHDDGEPALANALREPEQSGEAESRLYNMGFTPEIPASVGRELDGHGIRERLS